MICHGFIKTMYSPSGAHKPVIIISFTTRLTQNKATQLTFKQKMYQCQNYRRQVSYSLSFQHHTKSIWKEKQQNIDLRGRLTLHSAGREEYTDKFAEDTDMLYAEH